MKTIESLNLVSVGELRKIRDTLCRRYGVGRRGNVLGIAFGVAEKRGGLDSRRRDAICFFVRDKRLPRSRKDRIPDWESVRIRRGGQYVRIHLATDVILAKRSTIKLTGRSVRHLSRRAKATAGCIVAWRPMNGRPMSGRTKSGRPTPARTDAGESFRWGVMTVGHLFSHLDVVPESERRVRVLIPTSAAHRGDREIAGTLLARTRRGDGSRADAAIVQVRQGDLIAGGVLPSDATARAQQVRGLADLKSDPFRNGLTLPDDSTVAFTVKRFHPVFDLIPEVGPLDHVLDVESSDRRAFAPGRSGALWIIAQQGCCLQFAGWDVPGSPQLSYRTGSGQSLEKILDWARGAIARIEQVAPSVVQMRLVRQL